MWHSGLKNAANIDKWHRHIIFPEQCYVVKLISFHSCAEAASTINAWFSLIMNCWWPKLAVTVITNKSWRLRPRLDDSIMRQPLYALSSADKHIILSVAAHSRGHSLANTVWSFNCIAMSPSSGMSLSRLALWFDVSSDRYQSKPCFTK